MFVLIDIFINIYTYMKIKVKEENVFHVPNASIMILLCGLKDKDQF